MVYMCCVESCREKGKHVKFHRIPIADCELCQIWLSRIGNDDLFKKDAKTLGNYQICHKDFDDMCKIERPELKNNLHYSYLGGGGGGRERENTFDAVNLTRVFIHSLLITGPALMCPTGFRTENGIINRDGRRCGNDDGRFGRLIFGYLASLCVGQTQGCRSDAAGSSSTWSRRMRLRISAPVLETENFRNPEVVVLRRRHEVVHCSIEESGGYLSDEVHEQLHSGVFMQSGVPYELGSVESHAQYPVLEQQELMQVGGRNGCPYGECVRHDGFKCGSADSHPTCEI
ncbi:hypothetical protein Trydic_g20089 [Trypoxylus dichotomus]